MPIHSPSDRPDLSPLPRGMTAPISVGLPLAGLTVLLVEDSRLSADILRLLCQRSGARMRRADTVDAALSHLRTYRPDVVIVDLGLPDGDGVDLIRQMAGRVSGIIAISGDPGGKDAALAAGATTFLEKPLPGLAIFQSVVTGLLSGALASLPAGPDCARPDPIALRDDLNHAVDVLDRGDDPSCRHYLAGFLNGLARSTGDITLSDLAKRAEAGGAGRDGLRRALRERALNGGVI